MRQALIALVLAILVLGACYADPAPSVPSNPIVQYNADGTLPGEGPDLQAIQRQVNGDNNAAWARYHAQLRRVKRQNAIYGDAAIALKTADGLNTAHVLAQGGVELNPLVGVPFMPILLSKQASGRENTVDILAGACIVFGGPVGALMGHIARGWNYSHYIHRVHRVQLVPAQTAAPASPACSTPGCGL